MSISVASESIKIFSLMYSIITFLIAIVFIADNVFASQLNNVKSSNTPPNTQYKAYLADPVTLKPYVQNQNSMNNKKIDLNGQIAKGLDWIVAQRNFKIDILWILGQIYEITDDQRALELFQKEWESIKLVERFDVYKKLIDEDYSLSMTPRRLSKTSFDPTVTADWLTYAINFKDITPPPEILSELFNNSYSRYKAAHQLLAIVFLKEQGYQKDDLEPKIKSIVDGLIAELNTEVFFNDLYAERIALVQYAGYGNLIKQKWIDVILGSQNQDGSWTYNPRPQKLHTSILALWALAQHQQYK